MTAFVQAQEPISDEDYKALLEKALSIVSMQEILQKHQMRILSHQ